MTSVKDNINIIHYGLYHDLYKHKITIEIDGKIKTIIPILYERIVINSLVYFLDKYK